MSVGGYRHKYQGSYEKFIFLNSINRGRMIITRVGAQRTPSNDHCRYEFYSILDDMIIYNRE